jgi:hypothetical protein
MRQSLTKAMNTGLAVNEIIAPLSEDERAVLMIAAQGQYMIPIGRWEQSVKALTARGFLRKLDNVNYVITEAGRKASEDAETDAFNGLFKVSRRYGN